jgi:hypothetical protein
LHLKHYINGFIKFEVKQAQLIIIGSIKENEECNGDRNSAHDTSFFKPG